MDPEPRPTKVERVTISGDEESETDDHHTTGDVKHRFDEAEDPTVFGELVTVYAEAEGEEQSSKPEDNQGPIGSQSDDVTALKLRVGQLEQEVESLQGELRLIKRKLRGFDPLGDEYQAILEKSILRVFDSQHWKVSRLKEAVEERSRSGRVIKPNRKWTPRSSTSGFKRPSSYLESEEEILGDVELDNDITDPTFRYDSNTENIKPAKVTNTSRSLPMKRGRGRPPSTLRRVIVVKKAESKSAHVDIDLEGGGSTMLKQDSKLVSAGDVSVILDDDDYDPKLVSGKKSVRVAKSPAQHRPKVLKCSHCPKMFRDQHDVTRHERTHTGEKPFYCQTCGPDMRFSQTYHLQRHNNKYHTFEVLTTPETSTTLT